MMEPTGNCHVLVIRTNSYIGNFMNALCAFVTGECGDGKAVEDYAEKFRNDFPDQEEREKIAKFGVSMPDGRGDLVTSIEWNGIYTDMGMFLESRPSDEELDILINRARTFLMMTKPCDSDADSIALHGFELIKYTLDAKSEEIWAWTGNEEVSV